MTCEAERGLIAERGFGCSYSWRSSMAHYLVELYSPKPAWLALSFLHRTDFLDQIKTNMEALPGLGIQLLT
ncbi:DUF6616 family protein, partial [Chromobacterium haemolyticum]|uniref:DUF6616 family protein n=1 Tax=Chromobacterium haemolyticum TaxID=394935 RepID=UPI003B97569D